jgi:hypothetical protein
MAHVVTDIDLKSAVLERRPHWSRGTDEQQARGAPRVLDAHHREAAIAFSILSWESMRGAVARPSAEQPTSAESGIAIPPTQ